MIMSFPLNNIQRVEFEDGEKIGDWEDDDWPSFEKKHHA
tara:strand:+ start:245 stop:361 length:117 start_codon:yes stop_codon:yes gene_type:complete